MKKNANLYCTYTIIMITYFTAKILVYTQAQLKTEKATINSLCWDNGSIGFFSPVFCITINFDIFHNLNEKMDHIFNLFSVSQYNLLSYLE